MKKKSVEKALGFLTLAGYYHHLVQNILEKTRESNPHVVFGSKETIDKYDEITKWSDFRVIVPTLFLFYHGLELQLKGLLAFHNKVEGIHSLEKLLLLVREMEGLPVEVIAIAERHIDIKNINPFIQSFIKTNGISIDDLYMALRYPTDKKDSREFSYFDLKYKEGKIIPYIESLITDCKKLNEETGKYYYQYRPILFKQ